MLNTKQAELVEQAKAFAHTYCDDPDFDGYTEAELAKGIAAAYIALDETVRRRENRLLPVTPETMTNIFTEDLGITGEEWEHAMDIMKAVVDAHRVRGGDRSAE